MKPRPALALVLVTSLMSGLLTRAQEPPTPTPTPAPAPAPTPAPAPAPGGPIEVNGIAAKVNGRVVTKNQVSFMLAPLYAQLAAQYPRRGPQFETKFKEAKAKIIQELVDRQIIIDEFKQLGASIKPTIIDEEIKRQMRELFNGDEVKFRSELKRSRLTMDGYREMTREKMIVQAMRAQQFSDAPPPLPNEIQKAYDEVKLTLRDVSKDVITFQKIFIPAADPQTPAATPEVQLAHAEDLAKQLAEGKDFSELAKVNSKDAFAEQGGLRENVPRTDLSPEFAAIIFEAPVGQIVGPLLDPQGFTLVKPIKIEFGPYPPFEKVREMIEERVRRQKTSAQYERWIESRRKRAMVDIRI
ncbi:MAG: SurA N-terminal domain-containing protein [Verrucomicrobia bacterium]|nr:SurA N-terminal domain-containing protein [Verrucomicrobiota bacterium]